MKSFQLVFSDRHPIIHDGNNILLIDTGAPTTIHSADKLNFCSVDFDCTTNYLGVTVSDISALLGTNITTLLGADILSEFTIVFDYKKNTVEFGNSSQGFNGKEIPLSNFMGVPIIEATVNQQKLKFFIDSGAKLSYLPESIANQYKSVGMEADYYPGIGKFETICYEIPTEIGSHELVVKYGILPPELQMGLMPAEIDGIIGYDFFKNFKLELQLKAGRLKYAFQPEI